MVFRALSVGLLLATGALAAGCVPMSTPAQTPAVTTTTLPMPAAPPPPAEPQAALDASSTLLYPYNLPQYGTDLAAVAR